MQVDGKHILVVGAARSGVAAAQFLRARGAHVTLNDSKPVANWPEASVLRGAGIEIVGGGHPLELFAQADLIVVSPGVPLALEPFQHARKAGVPVIGEAELAARFLRGRLVGITGSNGKTTTTTLIGELLRAGGLPTQVGGNIGTALVSLVESSREDGFTVAELSSFQLEAVEQLHLFVAVLINITPDHLDRYASMDEYAAAKANILINQTEEDFAVLNADDARIAPLAALTKARILWFSTRRELSEGLSLRGEQLVSRRDGQEQVLLERADIRLRGAHNLENVLCALAAGLACGVAPESMRQTIRAFHGVEHRLEFVAELNGVQYYNDSKATNVDAALKSLEAFPGGVTVILGGKDKGGDYTPLAPLVTERCAHVILIGAAAETIASALAETRPLHRAATMRDAVRLGEQLTQPGGVVLLAPACASFDMFDNFEQRGRVFKKEVGILKSEF
jgi:UDP-N-acetylmuramoylalanine--D-glutamate ligase